MTEPLSHWQRDSVKMLRRLAFLALFWEAALYLDSVTSFYRLALDPHKSNPRVVDTLLRISERYAKLLGLDAPQRIEASGPDGGPIQTREEGLDFSKLSIGEKLALEQLMIKACAPHTPATQTLPAMLRDR